MSDFINTIATIGGVLFFLLVMMAIGAVVYATLTEEQERNRFEDPNYDWQDIDEN